MGSQVSIEGHSMTDCGKYGQCEVEIPGNAIGDRIHEFFGAEHHPGSHTVLLSVKYLAD